MRFGTILDVGVRIVRRRWAVLLGLAVLFVGPGALLTAATGMRFTDVAIEVFPRIEDGILDRNAVITDAQLDRLLGALMAYVAATIVAGVLASIGALGFSAVVGADYHHRAMSFGEALRVALRRASSAIVFILVTTALIIALAVGALLLIVVVGGVLGGGTLDQGGPGVFAILVVAVALVLSVAYLTMRWAPAFPVMANEGAGWRQALSRSWHLSGDNVWRITAVILFAAIATAVLTALVSELLVVVLVDGVATTLGLDPTIAASVVTALGTVLLAALAPVWTAVLYYDLCVRRDPPPVPGDSSP
jgi:Membrane domain of glycerophosphoryl diester phosphodiesterase